MSNEDIDVLEDIESYSPSVQNISIVITVIASFHILSGIIAIPIANLLLSVNIFQAPTIITVIILIDIAMLIISIPLYFILAWAIWSLQSWAWKMAIIINLVILVLSILGGIILIALLNIAYLLALSNSEVKLALAPVTE